VPEEKVSTPKGKKTLHLEKTTTSQARIARSSARRISNSQLLPKLSFTPNAVKPNL
jgi:hypothetical protein